MQFKARKFDFLDPSKANFIAWQKSERLDNSKENFSIFMDSTQGWATDGTKAGRTDIFFSGNVVVDKKNVIKMLLPTSVKQVSKLNLFQPILTLKLVYIVYSICLFCLQQRSAGAVNILDCTVLGRKKY
jgi:hypothetical protein